VNIRFRCLNDEHDHKAEGHGKYESLPGSGTWLYNTNALLKDSDSVGLIEGEIDAITSDLCGLPTVGAPGAQTWRPYMALPLLGYKQVIVIGDGDDAGKDFVNKAVTTIPGSRPLIMPDKLDANSFVRAHGVNAYKKKVGLI